VVTDVDARSFLPVPAPPWPRPPAAADAGVSLPRSCTGEAENLGMDQLPRNDSYRQLRLLISPSSIADHAAIAVVARTAARGAHRDRLLLRRYIRSDLDGDTISSVLRAASQCLFDAAAELERLGEAPGAPASGATGAAGSDVRSSGVTVHDLGPRPESG
jgi:hypothetical protein